VFARKVTRIGDFDRRRIAQQWPRYNFEHSEATVENKASKLGTAVAAAVLGLGLPAIASAQELPSDQPADTNAVDVDTDATTTADVTPVTSALTRLSDSTQLLSNMSTISSADIALISLGDMNLSADQRYTLAQNMDPSAEAALQQTLDGVTVQEARGNGDEAHSFADHLRMLGVEPTNVVAVNVDDMGVISVYYQ
jgi:hypothetical protein